MPYLNRPQTIGGATVLTNNFVQFCAKNAYAYRVVPFNRFKYSIASYLYILLYFAFYLPWSTHVMFNVSENGALKVFPKLAPFCRLFSKKIIFRKFGGNFSDYLDRYPNKQVVEKFLKSLSFCSTIFFETNYLVDYFRAKYGDKVHWFPNVRTPVPYRTNCTYSKKFVFVSRVCKEKGVLEIIDAFKSLPKGFTVDLYGPLDMKISLDNVPNIKYCGVIPPGEVQKVLVDYNVLLLPTYWKDEGYPGILIEAMSVGMPMIVTNIGGICELVTEKNALVVYPKDSEMLKKTILNYDEYHYQIMRIECLNRFNDSFNSDVVNNKIYNLI